MDLKPINCHWTQGSNFCEVTVSMDGNTVQLHPMENDNMYVYTVSENSMFETPYQPMKDRFYTVMIEDVVASDSLGSYSCRAVKFDAGDYGYLHTSDWTLGTLSYVRGDKAYPLFGSEEK